MLDYKFDFSTVSELKCDPQSGIDIVIAGGGPGGLFAALYCYRKGHNVKVLESSGGYDLNGGYVRIGSTIINSLNVFPGLREAFDLFDHNSAMMVCASDGEVLRGPIIPPKDGESPFAGMTVHRAALSRCLYEYAKALGIDVHFHTRIASYYEDDERGGCISKTGEHFEANLVIAADGIGSHSADLISTEGQNEVVSSGFAVFRSTFPAEDAYKMPHVKRFLQEPNPGSGVSTMMRGQHGYAVIFSNDEVLNVNLQVSLLCDLLVLTIPALIPTPAMSQNVGTKSKFHWHVGDCLLKGYRTSKKSVLAYVEEDGYCQVVRDLVSAAPDDVFFNWRLMFRNPTPNWVSPHGHVVQLGDAAHTFLPSSGNGATQALEDGICLATCLLLAGKSQIPLAAKVYNKLRFERTSCLQKTGFRNRNQIVGGVDEDFRKRRGPLMGAWATRHNPETYTYEKYGHCVNHLITGAPFQNDNIPPGHIYTSWSMDEFLIGKADSEEETGDWS